jgi:hypothetical protein
MQSRVRCFANLFYHSNTNITVLNFVSGALSIYPEVFFAMCTIFSPTVTSRVNTHIYLDIVNEEKSASFNDLASQKSKDLLL